MKHWEQGSDQHLSLDIGRAEYPWLEHPHGLYGSGRQALRGLLEWGRDAFGWQRLRVPSYFCQHTLGFVADVLAPEAYALAPTDSSVTDVPVEEGDVVLTAALFGKRPLVSVDRSATVIEDHSHDPAGPLAASSGASYAFASLRKAWPLPDGGVVWSPQGLEVPPPPSPTAVHQEAVLMRLSAMVLKRHYLDGADVAKDAWRRLFLESERLLGRVSLSSISDYSRTRLPSLPLDRWAAARARNLAAFRAGLGRRDDVDLLDVPFMALLVLRDRAQRDHVRSALIAERIYPSILWPLDKPVASGIPADHVALSGRALAIHVDGRYGPEDMAAVTSAVVAALDRA